MNSVNVTVRVDRNLKKEADELFSDLGLTMSAAFNIFLRQSVREKQIPFTITQNVPNAATRAALEEGDRMLSDPNAQRFSSVEDLFAELDS